jgi:hypothetical protein
MKTNLKICVLTTTQIRALLSGIHSQRELSHPPVRRPIERQTEKATSASRKADFQLGELLLMSPCIVPSQND